MHGGEPVAQLHVAQQEGHGFEHALAAQFVAVELPDLGAEIDQQRIVVQRLFQGRLQPAFVIGVAEEAAADMIVKTAEQHGVHGGEDQLRELRRAGAQEGVPQQLQQRHVGEFDRRPACRRRRCRSSGRCAARPCPGSCCPGPRPCRDCRDSSSRVRGRWRRSRPPSPCRRATASLVAVMTVRMPGIALLLLARQIAGHPEGHAIGGQEDVQRPAALVAHGAGGALVDQVQVGALIAVDQDRGCSSR